MMNKSVAVLALVAVLAHVAAGQMICQQSYVITNDTMPSNLDACTDVQGSITAVGAMDLTTINLPNLQRVNSIRISGCPALTTVMMNGLIQIRTDLDPPGLEIIDAPQLDTLQMMSLSVVYNHITVRNTGLISVSFPALDSFNRTDQSYMEIDSNDALTTLAIPSLYEIKTLKITDNDLFTTIQAPELYRVNTLFEISGCGISSLKSLTNMGYLRNLQMTANPNFAELEMTSLEQLLECRIEGGASGLTSICLPGIDALGSTLNGDVIFTSAGTPCFFPNVTELGDLFAGTGTFQVPGSTTECTTCAPATTPSTTPDPAGTTAPPDNSGSGDLGSGSGNGTTTAGTRPGVAWTALVATAVATAVTMA